MEPRNETFVNYESDLIHPLTDLDFKYDLPNFGTADSDRLPQLEMAFFPECFTNCGKDIYAFHYLRFPIKEPEWVDACSAHRRTHSFKLTATLSSSFHSLVATPQPLLLIKDTQSESLKEKEKTPFEERESKPHFPFLVPSSSFFTVSRKVIAPSVASTSTSAPPLQVLVDGHSCHDSLSLIAQ
ncbi:unnamed protein product [Malus baccata var. baccata]